MASVTLSSIVAATSTLLPPQLGRANYDSAARFSNATQGNRYEGFAGDGDYIELPAATGNNVEYFNNADASQFTVSKANINAAVDDWVGFTFDKTDGLIYIVGVDEGTAPDTFYLVSVDSAGTVVNIGNAQPGGDFSAGLSGWWHALADATGGSMIQRAADGTGNIFVRQANPTGMEEMEVNIATGAIVSDPAIINANLKDLAWKSAAGNYYSIDTAALQRFYNATTKIVIVDIDSANNFGWTTVPGNKLVQWKDRVVEANPVSANLVNNRISTTILSFDAWQDLVISTYGME